MTIFDTPIEPRSRVSDPATSHEAERNTDGLSEQRRTVLWALHEVQRHTHPDGATAYDILLRLSFTGGTPQQNVIARRLDDLQELGLAVPTERTRPGSSSRHLRVWVVTPEGTDALAS